jgi:hypothetical protein
MYVPQAATFNNPTWCSLSFVYEPQNGDFYLKHQETDYVKRKWRIYWAVRSESLQTRFVL